MPHYEIDAVHLGDDEHGTWTARELGTVVRRDGVELFGINSGGLNVIPRDAWWVAWFLDSGDFDIYVDICTPITWAGDVATCIDLDLDIVRHRADQRVEIVDEDELVEHAVTYAYPDELVARARAEAERMRVVVERREPPFDDETAARWSAVRSARAPATPAKPDAKRPPP